jgi:2,5-diketo-D-gluconate reductase B
MQSLTTQSIAIPRVGFGTYRMPGADAQPVVESAIALGYRHIDTAAVCENEASVGAAIAASGVKRNDVFITTKVWHDQLAPDALLRAFDASLRKLRLDYVVRLPYHLKTASRAICCGSCGNSANASQGYFRASTS